MDNLSRVRGLSVLSLVRNLPQDTYAVTHARNNRVCECVAS